MLQELLNEALALLSQSGEKAQSIAETLAQRLVVLSEYQRRSLYDIANGELFQKELRGLARLANWFFSHPSFEVFEDFWQDEALRASFADHLRVLRWCTDGTHLVRHKRFNAQLKRRRGKQAKFLAERYADLLARHYQAFFLHEEINWRGGSVMEPLCLMPDGWIISEESAWRVFEREEEKVLQEIKKKLIARMQDWKIPIDKYAKIFGESVPISRIAALPEDWAFTADDFILSLEVEDFVPAVTSKTRRMQDIVVPILRILKRGSWPRFRVETEPLIVATDKVNKVAYRANDDFLREIENAVLGKGVEILKRMRAVRYGRLPLGLKIHCVGTNVPGADYLEKGGFVAHNAGMCFNLPPVGSVGAAAELLDCIGKRSGVPFFNNPNFQIQVCSPGKLFPRNAALLGIAFYLGSDLLRTYHSGDFATTHDTGDRLIIYGAGAMDIGFEWWERSGNDLQKQQVLPRIRLEDRTDVLTCQSLRDIDNVNLVATLLVHAQFDGYWKELGNRFISEMEKLLVNHQLSGLLVVDWVKERFVPSQEKNIVFYQVLDELSGYAFQEVERIKRARKQGKMKETRIGILFEMQDLLNRYRFEIELQASFVEKRRQI